jgi:uncharacterized membrane protein
MVDPKLTDYIRACLAQGKSKEEIYAELLAQGRTVEAIQECFGGLTVKEEREDTQKRTIRVIVTLGAIFIGVGIFSFVAANWQEMARPAKVGIILTAMLISYGAGWYLKEKAGLVKTGGALILLGAITYGAGIFLVAQMFNIRANWPDGFILWMLGTIAMAFAVKSYPLFYLAVPLGMAAIVGHPFDILSGLGFNQFLLTSSLLLLAATIVTFIAGWAVYKERPPELKDFY